MKKNILDIYIKLLGKIYNLTHKEKATHAFYLSKEQTQKAIDILCEKYSYVDFDGNLFLTQDPIMPHFKGVSYSEMSVFENGWSNLNDAKLLGVGCYDDVAFKQISINENK